MAPIRTGSLRVIEDQPRPEDLGPVDVDVPSNEIAPGVTLDGGVMHVEHGDGSTTIDFDPKPESEESDDDGFYANLVKKISETELGNIASDLMDGIDRDLESRQEWLETRARGIQLLGLKLEEPRGDTGTNSAPLEGMSTVRHPLLLDATINFQATARGELLPASGPVKVRNDTPAKSPSSQSAQTPPPTQPQGPMAAGPGLSLPAPAAPQGFQQGGGVQPPSPAAGIPNQPQQSQQQQEKPPTNPYQQAAPFATELAIPPSEEKDSLAAALETDMNHYLTVTAREYYPDTDRMLFYIGFGGDGFKKVYNCPLRNRPVSESVDAEDLIVSNSATDLSNCGRVTHRIKMRKSIVKRMQILGVYADIDLGVPQRDKIDPVEEEKREIEGVDPLAKKPEDDDYTIYETYCELDLDRFAPRHLKSKGLPLPYRVTIHKDSRKVLSVVRNWKEEDKQALPKQFFTQFPFIRGLGFYALGFVHLLGNTTSTLTAMWREMTDAGMFANFPGFLFAKGAGRQLSNQFRVPPGGGIGLDVPMQMRIQDAVMPVPYKEPGAAFTQFAQWVEQAGQRIAQTAQVSVAEGKQEAPVGTTLALIEQATKIINSAHKRLHAAQSEEFMLLKERFKEDPEAFWRYNKMPAMQWEKEQFLKALEDYAIVPVADPNNPTSLHRAAKAQIIELTASKYPQLINGQAALKRIFRIVGIDTEGLMYDQPLPPPPDPRMVAISQKAQSTAQTVQMQTEAANQKAMAQVILGLKQVEAKVVDAQARNRIEQLRLMLEAQERNSSMANERSSALQDMGLENIRAAQEMRADELSRVHEARGQAFEQQQQARQAADDRAAQREEHYWEQERKRQQHDQDMERRQQEHDQKMRHARELHEANLTQQRQLARVQKKKDNPKK